MFHPGWNNKGPCIQNISAFSLLVRGRLENLTKPPYRMDTMNAHVSCLRKSLQKCNIMLQLIEEFSASTLLNNGKSTLIFSFPILVFCYLLCYFPRSIWTIWLHTFTRKDKPPTWPRDFLLFRINLLQVRDKYSGDINKTVYRIAYKKPNKVNLYIEKEDYAKACDLAISVLSVVEERKHSSHLQVSLCRIRTG